jgi:hypothetical protein
LTIEARGGGYLLLAGREEEKLHHHAAWDAPLDRVSWILLASYKYIFMATHY